MPDEITCPLLTVKIDSCFSLRTDEKCSFKLWQIKLLKITWNI